MTEHEPSSPADQTKGTHLEQEHAAEQDHSPSDDVHNMWERYQKRQSHASRAGNAALWIGGLIALIVLIISAIIVIQ